MKTITKQVFTKTQIGWCTFIGGPLCAGYLIYHNFKVFGDTKSAKKTIIIWALVTIAVFVISVLRGQMLAQLHLNYLLPIVYTVSAITYIKSAQEKQITKYISEGYRKASFWRCLGISLLSLVITFALFFGAVSLFDRLYPSPKDPITSLSNYCDTYYNEQKLVKNKIYIPEDASCFVRNRLQDQSITLHQVDDVLNLEFEYLKSKGVVNEKGTVDTSNTQVDPLPYIKSHMKDQLSDSQINAILDGELEYMKYIGIGVN